MLDKTRERQVHLHNIMRASTRLGLSERFRKGPFPVFEQSTVEYSNGCQSKVTSVLSDFPWAQCCSHPLRVLWPVAASVDMTPTDYV
jgi:hypothetical protein